MKKRAILVASVVLLACAAVIMTLFLTESLPEKVLSVLGGVFSDTVKLSEPTTVPIDEAAQNAASKEGDGTVLPVDLVGAAIDLRTDFTFDITETASVYLTKIHNTIVACEQAYVNTFFLSPGSDISLFQRRGADGVTVDLLKYTLLDTGDAAKILVIDASFLGGTSDYNADILRSFLRTYSFRAVLLADSSLQANGALGGAVRFLSAFLRAEFPLVQCGVQAYSPTQGDDACSPQLLDLLRENVLDFVCVETDTTAAASSPSLQDLLARWNQVADDCSDVRFFCTHANWTNAEAMKNRLYTVCDYPGFTGSVFRPAAAITSNAAIRAAIAGFYYDSGSTLTLQSIVADEYAGTVTFAGTHTSGTALFCNREAIQSDGAAFSYTATPLPGENLYRFRNRGKTVTYSVYRYGDLIAACYPHGTEYRTPVGEPFYVYAQCLRGATVSVSLFGKEYRMEKTLEYPSGIVPIDGYDLYVSRFTFSNNTGDGLSLGELKITATLDGSCQIMQACPSVTVAPGAVADESFYATASYASSPGLTQLQYDTRQGGFTVSPYRDNGLGGALLCRIIHDDTEQLSTASYDTFQPTKSALQKGTYDYVVNIASNNSGFIRYDLQSGISILADKAELIAGGYKMPSNTLRFLSVDDTNAAATSLTVNADWLVPITATLEPQTYQSGYSGYSYNVDSFTAEYLDVVFHYTGQALGTEKLTFSPLSVISHAQTFTREDGTLVLRLHLRQKGVFYGWNLETDEKKGNIILSFKNNASKSLAGKVVMLDPGHGGYFMTGAALSDESQAEKDIVLTVAYKLKAMLEAKGATVLMTRTDDTPLSLEERLTLCCRNNPDLFVSLHCDGSDTASDSGTHTFYYTNYSMPLAQAIHTSLVSYYRSYIYTQSDSHFLSADNGIKYYPFAMIRAYECPAVLVEMGYLTNAVEGRVLVNEDGQYWLAEAISVGIGNYFAQ